MPCLTYIYMTTATYIGMVYSREARAIDSQHGGHEFESQSRHFKPETKLLMRKGGKAVKKTLRLCQTLLKLKKKLCKHALLHVLIGAFVHVIRRYKRGETQKRLTVLKTFFLAATWSFFRHFCRPFCHYSNGNHSIFSLFT